MRNLPKLSRLPALFSLAAVVMIATVASTALLLPAGAQAGKGGKPKPGKVGDDIPECGKSTPSVCRVDVTVHQGPLTMGATCDSFDNSEGLCVGGSTGTPAFSMPGYFPRQGIETSFTWKSHGGAARDVDYTSNATFTIVDSFIRGDVPSSNSAVFNVTDAYSRDSGVHWKTVSTGGAPGKLGGPLYIDYDHPRVGIGSSVHMFGYLVRK
jgi:hypothetical protein